VRLKQTQFLIKPNEQTTSILNLA